MQSHRLVAGSAFLINENGTARNRTLEGLHHTDTVSTIYSTSPSLTPNPDRRLFLESLDRTPPSAEHGLDKKQGTPMTTPDFRKYDDLVFATRSYFTARIARDPVIDITVIDHTLTSRVHDFFPCLVMPYQIRSKNTATVIAAMDEYLSWARLFPRVLAFDSVNLREVIVKNISESLFDEKAYPVRTGSHH